MSCKILYIEWIDAVADCGWQKMEDVEGIHHCQSIGFLVKEDAECLVLAATVSDKESNARIAIPKAWIKKKRIVKL